MRCLIVIALALLALPVRAQDTTGVSSDVAALRERGVPAEVRSKTTKRNPETGRSTIAMVEAYTRGLIADADGDLVYFLAADGDDAWIRPNAVALLAPADDLIRLLQAAGRDTAVLEELNRKWFPRVSETGDAEALRAWETGLLDQDVPVIVSRFEIRVDDDGDVYPSFGVKNISRRTVAGVSIEILGFNRYGDVIRDKTTGMATHYATLPGTIRAGDTALFNYTDTPIWSNRSTTCVEIRRIVATFDDGTEETVEYQLKEARMAPEVYHTMGECSRVGSG